MFQCETVKSEEMKLVGISYSGPQSSFPHEALSLHHRFEGELEEMVSDTHNFDLVSPYFSNGILTTYFACVEVEKTNILPEDMVRFNIPPQKYAKVTCTNTSIGEGYQKLNEYLNDQKLVKEHNACTVEKFYVRDNGEPEVVELYIPIKE
jgi:predicted transcriptional regulator YdeE